MKILKTSSFFLFGVAFLSGCEPATSVQEAAEARPVKIASVISGAPEQVRRFPGVVEATQSAELTFRVGGEIIELPVLPGQSVSKEQLIAKLDDSDYQLALQQAQARADLAQAQYTRTSRLRQENIASQAEFDQAKAERDMAQAQLETAQANVSYTELHAPFAGVISLLQVEPFENVAPQQPILTLQTDETIDVAIQVPERLFARVRREMGYQPDVQFDSFQEHTYKASVREWDRIADPATNTYRVVFTLPKPEHFNVLPGMTATVSIDSSRLLTGTDDAVSIPVSALFNDGITQSNQAQLQHFVWVFEGEDPNYGTVRKQPVTIGFISNEQVSITTGLQAGDEVVSAGVHQLQEGIQVKRWVRERGL
ncbi:MAG: RND-type HAE1 family hydrophobe/amphiphile system membrane fusion component [Idiomarinaceae bacterium HL-53]|nr:MAG: RND-type HAE1 family hydrophobe/amphiphile system membrane fusion component [Idiomarinaceae bacterium HL-53]CUS47337.1 RND family efflux transporter, MFP subunit [Idiomarinaceae bacterium HL-53]